jgi:shikimate dehydrogenase
VAHEKFRLAGVMGFPVGHSRSPAIHNHWLRKFGLAGQYLPLEVDPKNLERALRGLPALGFSGANLTIPHKELAMTMVDHVDDLAQRVGAGNCCVVMPDGSLSLRNYDVFGYFASIEEQKPDWRGDAGPAMVLGAGGAARAVVVGLLDRGAPEIRMANRSGERAEALRDEFGPRINLVSWEDRHEALSGVSLLVNTTSLGMVGQPPLDLRLDALPSAAAVSDAVYAPLKTGLLAAAEARGNPIVNGLGMLLHQARPAFRDWWGIMPEVTPELRAEVEAGL